MNKIICAGFRGRSPQRIRPWLEEKTLLHWQQS